LALIAASIGTALLFACSSNAATPVDVALGDVSVNKVPFLIAADAGIYVKNGLEVHQFITPGAAEDARGSGVVVPAEYVRKDVEVAPIAVGGGSPMIYRAVTAGGADRVVLATHEGIVRSHLVGVASIGSIEQLKGKRLGYSGTATVTHFGLLTWVRRMGWDAEHDVTLVDRASTLNAVTDGRVDAAMSSAMLIALAPEKGLRDIVDLAPYKIPLAGSGIMAERKWLAANRDTAAKFVKSAVDAVALMKGDRNVFNASLAKWFNIKDPVTQQRMYSFVAEFPDKPYPSVEGIKAMMALYDSPAMRAHRAEEFYDSSFVQDLDRSGYLDATQR
jgi:ABC-type nitrate/sulfonate/bicarbonate transport system substrate-binding protein